MKKALLIAYHYPPVSVSSGLQRTLKYSQYLSSFSWRASVLSIDPIGYEQTDDGQLDEIPEEIIVKRALGFDASRHFSIRGRYLGLLSCPDRWVSWWPMAVLTGLYMMWRQKVDVIYSTYPIATAHLIALMLHKLTGRPWVADFRDSMLDDSYPVEIKKRRQHAWLEKKVIKNCTKAIFTTPSTLRMYKERYSDLSPEKWHLIENAFDEGNFEQAKTEQCKKNETNCIHLVHSGVLYPSERDPIHFFDAIAELKNSGLLSTGKIRINLRATGHDNLFRPMIKERNIEDIVFLESSIPYVDALKEMLEVDGLLVFQASNCNHQIPAKVYEYLRAEKPILALTDSKGDTAGVLKKAQVGAIVALDDKEQIKQGLIHFIQQIKEGSASKANEKIWSQHTRYARTEQLAKLLDQVVS